MYDEYDVIKLNVSNNLDGVSIRMYMFTYLYVLRKNLGNDSVIRSNIHFLECFFLIHDPSHLFLMIHLVLIQSAIVARLKSYNRPLAEPMLININDEDMYQHASISYAIVMCSIT